MNGKSLLLFPALVLAACTDSTGPQPSLDGLPPGLSVALTVQPAEVSQHESFTVELSVTNTTANTIQYVTSHGCLALPNVVRSGQRIPFEGTALGCFTAITTHTFAPGETRSLTWDLRAQLYAQHPGEITGLPAPTGLYTVQAVFDPFPIDGSVRKPTIEALLRVM